jgi:hypothetical protein
MRHVLVVTALLGLLCTAMMGCRAEAEVDPHGSANISLAQ